MLGMVSSGFVSGVLIQEGKSCSVRSLPVAEEKEPCESAYDIEESRGEVAIVGCRERASKARGK